MPPRFGSTVIVYYLIGVMLFAGGLTTPGGPSGLGITGQVVNVNTSANSVTVNQSTGDSLSHIGGPIKSSLNTFSGGGLLATLSLIVGFIGSFFWPVVVATNIGAPIVVQMFAGTFSVGMIVATMLYVRRG